MQTRKLKVTKPIVLVLVGIICASALWAGEAWAIKLIGKNDPDEKIFSDDLGHVILTKVIKLKRKGPVVIMYTAECTVAGDDIFTWLNIDIRVDGTAISPTNDDNAFCTSRGDGVRGSWVSAATQVKKTLSAGNHTVEIVGLLENFVSGDSWRIDDQSLIIIVQKN